MEFRRIDTELAYKEYASRVSDLDGWLLRREPIDMFQVGENTVITVIDELFWDHYRYELEHYGTEPYANPETDEAIGVLMFDKHGNETDAIWGCLCGGDQYVSDKYVYDIIRDYFGVKLPEYTEN